MRKGYDMKRKHLIILIAIVAALALTAVSVSAVLGGGKTGSGKICF